jgi:transglutaminase-like putative cysteine protease
MEEQLRIGKTWVNLGLVWAMIFVSAMAIVQADWIDGLSIIPLVGSLGMVAGFFLARSQFSPRRAHLFALIYGLFVVTYLCGTFLPDQMPWRDRVIDLFSRQAVWLQQAFGQGTSRDGFIFVIQTSVVYWALGYTAVWATLRYRHLWRTIVPTGLVLFSVVYYYVGPKAGQMSLYLAAYSLLAFMYIAYTYLIDQELTWQEKKVRYRHDIRFSFLRSGLVVGLAALIVAWSLPTMPASAAVNDALSGTQGPWRSVQEHWTRLFSSLRSYGSAVNDPYQDILALGGPRTVGNALVMDIYVPEKLSSVYWQAMVYDTYTDGRWRVGNDDAFLHQPEAGKLQVPLTAGREVVTQTVINFSPNTSIIYGAPELVGSNKEMYVTAGTDADGNWLVTNMRARYIMRQGTQYRVYSYVSMIDEYSLRQASLNYPDWVQSRYLQVPDSITAETRELAARLTANHNNPYDKAIAVRNYLRSNINYNDQIDAPPPGVDPIHHVLFVSREGYCNYYAAAMVILLRAEGIPARFVTGYAQGEWDDATRSYRVRTNHAHAWAEVYFPDYGWIQFEPTTAIPVIERPPLPPGGVPDGDDAFSTPSISQPPDIDRGMPDDLFMDDFFPPEDATASFFDLVEEEATAVSLWQIIGALLVVGVAVGLVVGANSYNNRIESDVSLSYDRLSRWGRWLNLWFQPTQTPHERAEAMVQKIPEGEQSIWQLTQQYVLKQFSRAHQPEDTFDPKQAWRRLRPLLLRRSLTTQWQRWWRRLRSLKRR